ncbi:MAG TPA: hypothetical protein VMV89_10765 [Candidatus Paceibacterota bacterium]|nr:hypothetical protein [Candidatus Paceibacterota bacterium]
MIKTLRVRPFGNGFFAQLHEFFLKTGGGLAAVGIARGHDASLAGVVAEKFHCTDLKRFEFVRCAKELVFAKRLATDDFKIGAEAAAQTVQCQFGKPFLNFAQASFTCDGRAKRLAVVGETFLRIALQLDVKSKKIAQPFFNSSG